MASGHVNRTNRPNTWLHRPSLRREDSPCQPGVAESPLPRQLSGVKQPATLTGHVFADRTLRNACRDQSSLMPADLVTLAHFSVSSAMSFPNSVGVIGIGTSAKSASRSFILGSARPAVISLLILSITSAGVPFGAPTPNHAVIS